MIKYPMIFHDGQAPSILHYIFQQHSLELTVRPWKYRPSHKETNIPNHSPTRNVQTPKNRGIGYINYQPQLVNAGFQPSTVWIWANKYTVYFLNLNDQGIWRGFLLLNHHLRWPTGGKGRYIFPSSFLGAKGTANPPNLSHETTSWCNRDRFQSCAEAILR